MITVQVHDKSLVEAMARLKQIPVSKVLRNAARDFARGAYKAIPTASVTRSEFYRIKLKNGGVKYLHESQITKRKPVSQTRKKDKTKRKVREFHAELRRKVRIGKGWSKATWITLFRALGITTNKPAKSLPSPAAVEAGKRSSLQATSFQGKAEITITDLIRFNAWGKSADVLTQHIINEGFKPALQKIQNSVKGALRRLWK